MYDDMYKDFYGEEYGESWYSAIPLIFLVSVVPLIVYGKVTNLTGDYYKYWNGQSTSIDFFSYYKGIWTLVFVALALVVFIFKIHNKSIKIYKRAIYIPMCIYSVLVILSTIFSDYKEISLWGFVERYEGMIVILAYMLILFITINLIGNNKNSIKAIMIALICSATIIGIIGLFQYLGHDFFKSSTGKHLILPAQYQSMADKLKFQFGDKIIYSTLYHYNYVGSYMAMLFPMTFTMMLLIKNKVYKVILGFVSLLMFFNLILCHSRAGIVGGIVAIIILLINLRKFFIKNWKMSLCILLIGLVGLVGFNIYSKGMLLNRISSLFKDAENMTKSTNNNNLKNIEIKDNKLLITSGDKTIKVENNSDKIIFKDSEDKIINTSINKENGQVIFSDKKYQNVNINIKDYSTSSDKKYVLEFNINNFKTPFLAYKDTFKFINSKGEPVELKPVEKWGFEGKERLGSARAYIWSRSIPLLKHSIILGYGPDTFAAKFPQEDYIGKLIAYDTPYMTVDKAHNLYLQNALNIGIIGLIAFLAMFIMYLVDCFKLYFKNDFEDFYSIVGLAILTAICGYLGAGFFNDSVVSVAPVFWVLFGMGVSINYKLKDDRIGKEKVS